MVFLFGFSRLPVLLERVVYYTKQVRGLYIADQMAAGYTLVVAAVVSLAALVYLQVSGAFKREKEQLT
jgi:multiple sugar transport system permease protein